MDHALPFSRLPWESRFVVRLPGDRKAENHTRAVRDACFSLVAPTPVRTPHLLGWSDALGSELGILRPDNPDTGEDRESLALLSGNALLPSMKPYAARYGGHQFGNWAGQLGDGRAITLGEALTSSAGRLEFQLKGAGPTPYSRRADGRAVLRSSLREFLCSEAMHFLGVPTTRALSLVSTGEAIVRDLFYDGNPKEEPGAIVCRVSPSFQRFGNFEILARQGEVELLEQLAQVLIRDHYPALDPESADVYGLFLDEISRRTAIMVDHWMRVGFVHGVMNTDNMSALGLTLDYGPYGWLEPFDPDWTPNTTDAEGRRYRFGNQASIAHWNLARLCEAFYPLIQDETRMHASLAVFSQTYASAQLESLRAKLGIRNLELGKLVEDLFSHLQEAETDYTIFFRALSNWPGSGTGEEFLKLISPAFYFDVPVAPSLAAKWIAWSERYSARLVLDGNSTAQRQASMKKANPKYVLRNYLAQNAITAAENGDVTVLERLLRVLQTPYDELPDEEDLAARRPEWARNAPGCSALSCSS